MMGASGGTRVVTLGVLIFMLHGSQAARRNKASLVESISELQGQQNELQDQVQRLQAELTRLSQQHSARYSDMSSASSGKLAALSPCPRGPPGFYLAPGLNKCYNLQPRDRLVNWTDANAICDELSPYAHLVTIETEEEQTFLQKMWLAERGIGSVMRFWTSARQTHGMWHWYNNRPLTFGFWIPTTLHNDDRFTCMAVYSNEAYSWGDVACWAPHLVTCEIPL